MLRKRGVLYWVLVCPKVVVLLRSGVGSENSMWLNTFTACRVSPNETRSVILVVLVSAESTFQRPKPTIGVPPIRVSENNGARNAADTAAGFAYTLIEPSGM